MKAAIPILLCTAATAQSPNLIPNGDFKLPTIPWAITTDTGAPHASSLWSTDELANASGFGLHLYAPDVGSVTAQLLVAVQPGLYHLGVTLSPAPLGAFSESTLDVQVVDDATTATLASASLFTLADVGSGSALEDRAIRGFEVGAPLLLRISLTATGISFPATHNAQALIDDVTLHQARSGTMLINGRFAKGELFSVFAEAASSSMPVFMLMSHRLVNWTLPGTPGELLLDPLVVIPDYNADGRAGWFWDGFDTILPIQMHWQLVAFDVANGVMFSDVRQRWAYYSAP